MLQETNHYRFFLEREFRSRVRRNPGYSMRSFARDLNLPPSKLSEVLRGLKEFSPGRASQVAERLKLSEAETTLFLALAGVHQKKSREARTQAEATLASLKARSEFDEISLERFRILADWHHFAILELCETIGFESDPAWIAGRLGITTAVAKEAIGRLSDFGLLAKDGAGAYRQTQANLATPSGIPSREIREHHSQILMKADQSLHHHEVSERDFSATTLAFSSSQLEEVRTEIKAFRRRLGKLIQDRPAKDRVYCFATQFFPLDQTKNNEGNEQ
ncbi:MAG: TIGR02147 family protein [Proteobacteria bacterium]|nr:MAG: TIGR02147 family protein [Pseudomonadota bacterium]